MTTEIINYNEVSRQLYINTHKDRIYSEIRSTYNNDDDYYLINMEHLDYSLTDNTLEFLQCYDNDLTNDLNALIPLEGLKTYLSEWGFYPISHKLSIQFNNFDEYQSVLTKYMELRGDVESTTYKFLKFAQDNDWELSARGLLGNYWITVYTDSMEFELKNEKLTNDILNVYLQLTEEIQDLFDSAIYKYMRDIDNHYLSDVYIQDKIEYMSLDELVDLVKKGDN